MAEVKQLVEKQMRADDETTEGVLIANLFVVPTRKKGLIGRAVTFTRHPLVFKTLFGPTNAPYSSNLTDDFVVASKENAPRINLGR